MVLYTRTAENGFIGVNVPLTRARAGSLSTRTTHPHFMGLLSQASTTIGVHNPVVNPYRLQTKGEVLAGSRNPSLLRQLVPSSVSALGSRRWLEPQGSDASQRRRAAGSRPACQRASASGETRA
jgi:hypothetical protein